MRLVLTALLALAPLQLQAATTPVTAWTDEADAFGNGLANWHSLAVMHMAMHDALNAAEPVYARWAPATVAEPSPGSALPQAAMETAAAAVLEALHPSHRGEIASFLADRIGALPAGLARDRGQKLGSIIGAATVARRDGDGFEQNRLFAGSDVPGVWRPTPPRHQSSGTTRTRPFLFPSRTSILEQPPPEPGSPRYLADVDVTRRLGGAVSPNRTPEQAEAAIFWAYQSTQRGYVHLAATLIDTEPERFSLADQARIMSQLTAAMADSAILIWAAKERWAYWRPVDAIRSGQFGVPPDPAWEAFIETPPHPEYPSGHAADCYTGAGYIAASLLPAGPLTYTAQSAPTTATRRAEIWSSDMGAAPAPVELTATPRQFPTLAAAAQQCADARIWAGAHFPSANEESRRISAFIVRQAVSVLPRLP